MDELYKYLPGDFIDWKLIEEGIFKPYVIPLINTMQEPKWHKEGNVYIHTKMVCEELIKLDEYKCLNKEEKLVCFLACLFHDVGKSVTTKDNLGEITSFHHGPVGAVMVREYLWKMGLCGKFLELREGICLLVKYHSVPVHFDDSTTKTIIRLSLNSKLTKYFNLKLLTIVAKADVLGRISSEESNHLENIELFSMEAISLDCYDKAFKFSDPYTKYQYLNGDNIWYDQQLYNNHYSTVILLCGLPGTGKDTYIKKNYPDMKVISLDDIREELGVSPTMNQSVVYEYAKKKAIGLLKNKETFIWNATNLTNLIRNKQLNLFHNYNASVKIIYLETDLLTNLERNKNREKVVPESVIYNLIGKINIVEDYEAEEVVWEVL